MSFWSYNLAAPKLWHSIGNWTPRILRTRPALYPYTPAELRPYRRLDVSDILPICEFWRTHYGDADWYVDARPAWVRKYLEDPSVIVLGVFTERENILIGTIVSTPFSGGTTRLDGKIDLSGVRVIEGLCVHSTFRTLGLAGYLITAMDYETSIDHPTVHLWSRESRVYPVVSTAFNIQTYAFVPCEQARSPLEPVLLPWSEMEALWHTHTVHDAQVLAKQPIRRRGGLEAWAIDTTIVVVSDTKRRTKRTHDLIWEVTWTGHRTAKGLVPGPVSRIHLETVAKQKRGLMFVTHSHCVDRDFPEPWQSGTSGYHSWYIYNFVGIQYHNNSIHALREEL